jgi:hypothetical protein
MNADLDKLLEEKLDESKPRKGLRVVEDADTVSDQPITSDRRHEIITQLFECKGKDPHDIITNFTSMNEELNKYTDTQARDLENYLWHVKSAPIVKEDIKVAITSICESGVVSTDRVDVDRLGEMLSNDEYLVENVDVLLSSMFVHIPKPVQLVVRVMWHIFRSFNFNRIPKEQLIKATPEVEVELEEDV